MGCVSVKDDIIVSEKKNGNKQIKVSCLQRTTLSPRLGKAAGLVPRQQRSLWGFQNGCAETNIVSRMMELPLKLMTLLMVTISRSSTTCLGPLMGRDSTSVALTLLVCWRRDEDDFRNAPKTFSIS